MLKQNKLVKVILSAGHAEDLTEIDDTGEEVE